MPVESGVEREVKMAAWAGFELPPLEGLVDGLRAEPRPPQALTAVYYDTADLRLARWGASVRHRSGAGKGWTVKLPLGDDGPALVRRELNFQGPPDQIPGEVASLVVAYARASPLAPVLRMSTIRRAVELIDAEGARVVEVVDDEVSVIHGGRVAARFREVEIEVDDRAPAGLLDATVEILRRAGAGALDPTPKVVRALGPRALDPPDVVGLELGPDPTAAALVREAVAGSVVRILRHDAGVRIGDDPEDVHQARVGTRRLRSDLRTFGPVLDQAWAGPLGDELRWLATTLGAVRDADVLTERLRDRAATLPEPDTAGLAPVFRLLARRREQARTALLEAMASRRYVTLLDALVDAANSPRCRSRAERRAAKVIPGLVARPWDRLARAVAALPADPPPDDLHAVRILTKRARYAADAAGAVGGRPARRLASALADLQEVLGDHQDAMVAEDWLRRALEGPGSDPGSAMAVGELIALQRAEAADCRRRWRPAWDKASRKSLRAWL